MYAKVVRCARCDGVGGLGCVDVDSKAAVVDAEEVAGESDSDVPFSKHAKYADGTGA